MNNLWGFFCWVTLASVFSVVIYYQWHSGKMNGGCSFFNIGQHWAAGLNRTNNILCRMSAIFEPDPTRFLEQCVTLDVSLFTFNHKKDKGTVEQWEHPESTTSLQDVTK